MPSLPKQQRTLLSNAVKRGRRVAETGARKALEALAAAQHEPSKSMTKEERDLRERLLAHGAQLGDRRDAQRGTQEIAKLASEMAYEHWHRILFARFLAECDLLIEPESGMPVSIDEVREVARGENADWIDLAASWAQRMLPQIFRSGDPVLEVALPPESRLELEEIVVSLPREVFLADDSLGWVYQFWQAEKKDEVNKSGRKIGAEELPAVTQLFTEDYMVDFLLDNTLGAWWAGKKLRENPRLAEEAESEEELRAAVALPRVPWSYLRFVRADAGHWSPAAGTFDVWPKQAREITCLDPSMGSGHFIVAMFTRLVAIRMAEEGIDEKSAIVGVIEMNVFGLEIDPRCAQIAVFNLALSAWRRVGFFVPRVMNLARCGIAVGASEAEWVALGGASARSRETMRRLWRDFANAPMLGSLIEPRTVAGDLFTGEYESVCESLHQALVAEQSGGTNAEAVLAAEGVVAAATILARRVVLIGTNVPYLVRSKQDDLLKRYSDESCPEGGADLATVFLARCRRWALTCATVTPQNWLYQKSYAPYRSALLTTQEVTLIATIGSGATSTASWDVLRCLSVITDDAPTPTSLMAFVETSAPDDESRAVHARESVVTRIAVSEVRAAKDAVMLPGAMARGTLLNQVADSLQGIKSGDDGRFTRFFWEFGTWRRQWQPLQSTTDRTSLVGGLSTVIDMADDGAHLARRQGLRGWGRFGVAVSQMREMPATFHWGFPFDSNVSVIVPREESMAAAIWEFCASPEYAQAVRRIDKSLAATNAAMGRVPFDVGRWQAIALERYGDNPPHPATDDPRQWFFHGHPLRSNGMAVQVCVAYLVGFAWPATELHLDLERDAAGLLEHTHNLRGHADVDGIVCLPSVKGEESAAERLKVLMGKSGVRERAAAELSPSTESWFYDNFFVQHCELFRQTPFIWQIWDGVKDGFSVLVNYHRLAAANGEGRKTLEKLRYSYLGDWIERQREDARRNVEGADLKLAAAEHLAGELEKILDGEPPYDLFVRWKPLHEQPIGWDPDINDGVRINIRPFIMAKPFKAKGKNACILRATPKIAWKKDRGTEPNRARDDYPWFWGWDEQTQDFAGGSDFDGNRWNDLHYTRAFKEAARKRARERKG